MTPRHATTAHEPFLQAGIKEEPRTPVLARPGASDGQPEGAGQPDSLVWLSFTGDHDPADAAGRFQVRYGTAPARVVHGLGGLLLVGPIPSEVTS